MKTAVAMARIGVLGPLEVRDTVGAPVHVGGQRVRALLILLALEAGRPVPATVLIERLWPDSRPADAANALQSLVSRLRAALRQASRGDGVVESSPAGYRLAVPAEAVDALAFEARARSGARALAAGDAATAASLLREALTAWRGPALADVAGEEFAFAPAARLTELRDAARLNRIEADLMLGGAAAVTGELRELTAADPLAERPAALLMRALAAEGRQAEALAVYQQARELLADRLGVDPSSRLEQVHLAILRQEIGPPAAPAPASPGDAPLTSGPCLTDDQGLTGDQGLASQRNLVGRARPAGGYRPPTSFVGRDEDVARVLKRLAAERLVTLTGPGGVGKTRLAAEAAAQLGVLAFFAELAPVTDPSEVPYALLDALGLRERSIARRGADAAGDPADRLCAALAGSDAVLIIDNCEHVIDAAASLTARLLADCPGVRVLATSREPLQIPGETLCVVAPLPVPPVRRMVPTSGLDAYPAVRLFADRAAAVLSGFTLDATNADAVARICHALDGMPLAIELAVPWLRTLTPAQLADRLDDRFALLTGGSRTALPRHKTLRAVVDASWQLLSEAERVLAGRLAVFPGGATLAAAEQVCADGATGAAPGQPECPAAGQAGPVPAASAVPAAGAVPSAGGLTRAQVLPALSGLVAKSIVTAADADRYRMLETVRAYCLERLAEAGEETRVRDAFAAFCLNLAETADPILRTAEQARWFRVLAAEQDNTNAALRWAIGRGDAATALRFVRALGYFWAQRGHGEGDVLAREVLAMRAPERVTKPIAEARVICALLAAGWSWDIESIRPELVGAIAALKPWGNDYADFHPLVALAEPLLMQFEGDFEQAMTAYDWYAESRDPWLHAMGLLYRGSHALSLGRLAGAEDACRAALREFRALGERWGTALAVAVLNDFTELRADHAASIEVLEEAAAIGRELEAWGDLTYVRAKLAIIRARAGDFDRAHADLAQVDREVAARGAAVDTDRWVTFLRAELAWLEGDIDTAARCCEQAITAVAHRPHAWWNAMRAHAKARLAMVYLRGGDQPRCARMLAAAVDAAAAWPEHPPLAAVLDACAAYVLGRGEPADTGTAARLLGAAHAVRGAFDESSLDAPAVRAAVSEALGPAAFDAAYRSGRELTYEAAVALARESLAMAQPAGESG